MGGLFGARHYLNYQFGENWCVPFGIFGLSILLTCEDVLCIFLHEVFALLHSLSQWVSFGCVGVIL